MIEESTLWIERLGLVIDALGVLVIVLGTVVALATLIMRTFGSSEGGRYEVFKIRMGRAMLVGLEILLAADIIKTVALAPTFGNLGALGLLVLIRTFLGWTLLIEIEGRWPWQEPRSDRSS